MDLVGDSERALKRANKRKLHKLLDKYGSVEEIASKLVKVVDTVEPDAVLAAKYEERYQLFKQIYPACKPIYEIIK